MGIIKKIKDLLGLTAIHQQMEQQQQQQQLQQERFLAVLEKIANQNTPSPVVPSVPPSQPIGERDMGQMGQAGQEPELRKQLELAQKQIEGLQLLLSQSKETAVKEYLAAAKEVVKKASEPGAVGRPALPGTKINLKIEEDLYEKICFLKETVPGFKITAFCNAAIARYMAVFYDEHPELLQVLQKHIDAE